MPLRRMELGEFRKVAVGISRPEDVKVRRDGRVFASHADAAVAEVHADGTFSPIGPPAGGAPNGLMFDRDGTLLIANFGVWDHQSGPLERVDVDTGERTTVVAEVNGRTLTACNYPVVTAGGTIYCSHSTWADSWPKALDGRADGFIFAVGPDGDVRVVAENLRFPNGLALDAEEAYLYCTETSWADVLRFRIRPDGSLGSAERYGPKLGIVTRRKVNPKLTLPSFVSRFIGFTDGIGIDVEGNVWVTLPAARKLVAITPQGKKVTILHDPAGEMLVSPTNVSWGGADLTDLYVGSYEAGWVLTARSPVAGLPTTHQRG